MTRRHAAGWTVIELLVAISIMLLVIGLTVNAINYGDRRAKDTATTLLNTFAAMEVAYNNYVLDKGAYPSGMSDATFVPSYLFTPKPANGFGAYSLANSGANYYGCAATSGAVTAESIEYKALETVKDRISADKFFINTVCGAITSVAPTGSSSMAGTYWFSR